MILSKQLVAFLASAAVASLKFVSAECPNACSGHGQCGNYDMCACDRNWQGSDCSLRTCPFGKAHVDTPKGDLDASNSVEQHNQLLVEGSTVYPFGTTEAYPYMIDTFGTVNQNTAHDYMECSNKGVCDRKSGTCECLPGYDGVSCQRASCPSKANSLTAGQSKLSSFGNQYSFGTKGSGNSASAFSGKASANVQVDECSGHGTCQTISELAFLNDENIYELWDKDSTMGCVCDSGYSGPDCSERQCKYGIDPLWTDDTTAKITQTTVRFKTSVGNTLSGQYAVKFYDIFGDDHVTAPISLSPDGVVNTLTQCDMMTSALKALPNGVVPDIDCSVNAINTNEGFEYTLTFTGNPGNLKEIELDEYLDGSRPTVLTSSGTYTANVYTKVIGEQIDYFPTKCEGLTVKVLADSVHNPGDPTDNDWNADARPGSLGWLSGPDGILTAAEEKLLKKCLGDSDYDVDNNVEVTDWDYGSVDETDSTGTYKMIGAFPHAVKIVPKETTANYDRFSNGNHHLVWYDSSAPAGRRFRVANINDSNNDDSEATESYIFTTTGTVQQMAWGTGTELADNSGGGVSTERIVGWFDAYTNKIYTNYDTSCENQPSGSPKNHVCVERGVQIFIMDSCWGVGYEGSATTNPFFGGPTLHSNCAKSTNVNYNTGNLYTVNKVYTVPMEADSSSGPNQMVDAVADPSAVNKVNTYVIEVDANLSWEGVMGDPENTNPQLAGANRDTQWSDNTGVVTLFHFTPNNNDSYEYVSQCSNRGLCDNKSGLCQCFKGYTGDDCSVQNALAM